MSVSRQVVINQLEGRFGIPQDVLHEVKSFCFYDAATAAARALHREKVACIVDCFNNACLSRARIGERNSNREIPHADTCEHWAICLDPVDSDINKEVQFQATSCGICGNYKHSPTWLNVARRDEALDQDVLDVVDFEIFMNIIFTHASEIMPQRLQCYC
jgi:hypothetical protein